MIKRYSFELLNEYEEANAGMFDDTEGQYVLYEDYEKLEDQCKALENDCNSLSLDVQELKQEAAVLRDALEWYAEQSRLCRLIHSEGDKGRNALAADGGALARAALAEGEAK
jgi:uncharacterized protein YdcH (DUF465 family)